MNTVILDASGDDNNAESGITKFLQAELERSGHNQSIFALRDMHILPCRSCGACAYQSPGVCVQNDDAPQIIRAVANSGLLIIVTPLSFGGYPSRLKKTLDRFMILGLPLYRLKDGHMLHPMRYATPSVLAIGLAGDESEQKDNILELLVSRNAMNMSSPTHKTIVYNRTAVPQTLNDEIESALNEVTP